MTRNNPEAGDMWSSTDGSILFRAGDTEDINVAKKLYAQYLGA